MFKNFWNDESGVIISAELVLVLTIGVLATIVGMSEVASAVNTELNDTANAIGSLNQSFSVTGFGRLPTGGHKTKAFTFGFGFTDHIDECDTDTSCDIIRAGSGPMIMSVGG